MDECDYGMKYMKSSDDQAQKKGYLISCGDLTSWYVVPREYRVIKYIPASKMHVWDTPAPHGWLLGANSRAPEIMAETPRIFSFFNAERWPASRWGAHMALEYRIG